MEGRTRGEAEAAAAAVEESKEAESKAESQEAESQEAESTSEQPKVARDGTMVATAKVFECYPSNDKVT